MVNMSCEWLPRLWNMRRAVKRARPHTCLKNVRGILYNTYRTLQKCLWGVQYISSFNVKGFLTLIFITKKFAKENSVFNFTVKLTKVKVFVFSLKHTKAIHEKWLKKLIKIIQYLTCFTIITFLLLFLFQLVHTTTKTKLLAMIKQVIKETVDLRFWHVKYCLNTFTYCLTCLLCF